MPVRVPVPDVASYQVVALPPRPEEFCWAGAPGAIVASDGAIWLTYRLRTPEERGGEVRIVRTADGVSLETVEVLRAGDLGVRSLERSALVPDGRGGFELYVSYDNDGRWEIGVAEPEAGSRRLRRIDALFDIPGVAGVKDPVVFDAFGERWMAFTAYRTRVERTFVARAEHDGWRLYADEPLVRAGGWHRLLTRPAAFIETSDGLLVFYEGCDGSEHEPIYNIRTGVALTRDLKTASDLTPDRPLLESPTPGQYTTLRYLQPVRFDQRLLFYYEAARPDDAFELRLSPSAAVELPDPRS